MTPCLRRLFCIWEGVGGIGKCGRRLSSAVEFESIDCQSVYCSTDEGAQIWPGTSAIYYRARGCCGSEATACFHGVCGKAFSALRFSNPEAHDAAGYANQPAGSANALTGIAAKKAPASASAKKCRAPKASLPHTKRTEALGWLGPQIRVLPLQKLIASKNTFTAQKTSLILHSGSKR
jgi:hypothetical protein